MSGKKDPQEVQKRMRFLEKEIRKHQKLYYIENKPVITDRQFDLLLEELQKLETKHPEFKSKNSPGESVGSDLNTTFPKYKHTIPVLSLTNSYSIEEALEWAEKVSGGMDLHVDLQWKVDGATLVLYYKDGILERAVTRGTGQIGDDVTANALTIKSIPHTLKEKATLAVRGEAYMTYEDFESFNEQWGSIYANPRNLTSGSLKQKNTEDVAARPIRWVAFDAFIKNNPLKKDSEVLREIESLGIPVFADNRVVKISQLKEVISEYENKRDASPIPVDGLVIKVDDLSIREDQGYTAHSPRWAVAYKFEPEIAETEVEEIEVFVGRTGRVTPRARLKPVKLAGTTVTYATLHNADFIKNLDVRIHSLVKVSKRGEIIPAVEEVIDQGSEQPYVFPKKCPSCSSKLVRDEDAADWMCVNALCEEKIINRLIFFCQRKQMDLSGMGEKVVRFLYENKFISSLPDIYRLDQKAEELSEKEGFGKKSVEIILRGIEKSKAREFRYVLPSLGLREIGPSTTEILISNGYSSLDSILSLAKSDDAEVKLTEMDGIGPRTAMAVIEQLTDKKITNEINELKKAGLQFESQETDAHSDLPQIFIGQSWCVTGSFENFKPRDLAMEEIKKRGGKVVSSVTSKTTHLLAGEAAGSKLEKAKKLNVAVINEQEFIKLLVE
ncbi:MAG: NAD-dependent DNA ligase LigA [Spirochaetia bacterium]|nr:NAD-dependent DNA ligase LigA [Spirochaetia bacterium]